MAQRAPFFERIGRRTDDQSSNGDLFFRCAGLRPDRETLFSDNQATERYFAKGGQET